jgi:hypothetical protein
MEEADAGRGMALGAGKDERERKEVKVRRERLKVERGGKEEIEGEKVKLREELLLEARSFCCRARQRRRSQYSLEGENGRERQRTSLRRALLRTSHSGTGSSAGASIPRSAKET